MHGFRLGSTDYPGFEDGPLDLRLGLLDGSEFTDAGDLGRYAFDVVADAGDEESNRVNARVARTFGAGTTCRNEAGLSVQYGELYNSTTDEDGDAPAAAASRCGRWNLQLHGLRYAFDP